jgi:hypothetical protein
MKTKILSLFALALIASSCNKNNDLTVTLKQSGPLSVNVTNDAGTPLSDVKVKLYVSDSEDPYLDAINTDKNGNVNFGEVNSGSYSVVLDTPKVNGIKYMPVKEIQVVSGSKKEVKINVQEYIGTVNFTFYQDNYPTNPAFSGLNVILVAYNYGSSTLAYKIQKAEYSGKTNASGKISFKIPSSRTFQLVVYNDSKTNSNSITYFSVYKDDNINQSYYLDPVYLY